MTPRRLLAHSAEDDCVPIGLVSNEALVSSGNARPPAGKLNAADRQEWLPPQMSMVRAAVGIIPAPPSER